MTQHRRAQALRSRRATSPRPATGVATAEAWRVVAASVRGAGHERTGQPCQDAYHWAVAPNGTLVAAVGDGAGTAALGDVGARLATRAAVEAITARGRPPDGAGESAGDGAGDRECAMVMDGIAAARQAIEAEAAARGVATQELATTLILIVAASDVVTAAQVGDGAAVVRSADGELRALTTPRAGEYVNETTFLSSADALATAQWAAWRGSATHLGVLSDGLQMLALVMPGGTPHAPFFTPLLRFAAEAADADEASAQLASFLGGPRVTARTDDDVTLLLAARTGAPDRHS